MKHILLSTIVDLTVVHQILIILQRNVRHSLKISIWIDRKEIFELILKFELEQVISTKPFLLMIIGCLKDFEKVICLLNAYPEDVLAVCLLAYGITV